MDASEKILVIKEQLFNISKLQEYRKESVMKTLIEFQQMHNKIMECLEDILEKGSHVLIQDIKKIKNQIINNLTPTQQSFDRVN